MDYERDFSVEMEIARMVNRYPLLSCNDVRTAGGKFVNCGDRKLRYLAQEFKLRRHANYAYEYADKWYHFRKSFQDFCGVWLREQIKKQNRKHDRVAA